MIKFSAKLKVKNITDKSVKKRDGGDFKFTEVELEAAGKKPTTLLARAMDEVIPLLRLGQTMDMDIAISSFTASDGRVFNNFLITNVIENDEPATVAQTAAADTFDDIPF